ncbi:unnamed protein product, partial [Hapterophycus canaliculatus]
MQRYRLDASSEEGSLSGTSTLYGQSCDFPSINPKVSCQEHRYVWASCGAVEDDEACPLQGVVKVDTVEGTSQKWIPKPHEFMGEVGWKP